MVLKKLLGKTLGSVQLQKLGISVPDFVAIPYAQSSSVSPKTIEYIESQIGSGPFVVYNSTLLEMEYEKSFARSYWSNPEVSLHELPSKISELIEIAEIDREFEYAIPGGPNIPASFCPEIVVQVIVDADLEGIASNCVTRNGKGCVEIEFGITDRMGNRKPNWTRKYLLSHDLPRKIRENAERKKPTREVTFATTNPDQPENEYERIATNQFESILTALANIELSSMNPFELAFSISQTNFYGLQANKLRVPNTWRNIIMIGKHKYPKIEIAAAPSAANWTQT